MQQTTKYAIKYMGFEYATPRSSWYEWRGCVTLDEARLFSSEKNARASLRANVPSTHQPHCEIVAVKTYLYEEEE